MTAILEALKKTSPLRPGEIAAKTKIEAWQISRFVKLLVARGAVTVTGKTAGTRVHLGKPRAAAKEGL